MNPSLSFVLLFVSDPLTSKSFYGRLLALNPVEESPTFVMFALPNGVMLGLWSKKTAEPKVEAAPGASEVCFTEKDVDGVYASWKKRGVSFAQTPTEMDFGYTFVALDPDGHRIRVFWPKEEG